MDWTRRTCCSAVLANRFCDDIKHAMRYKADCLNTYCKNMPFSIKWYVYNCLYSIPTLTGEHLHLRITHKRHVCEYKFIKKNDPLCMAYHPYHFVGEVLYIYIYIYTVSLLYDLAGGSACRRGPCDRCISPLISLWRPQSSFSKLSDTSPTSQLILQPFRCFTYITAHSPPLLSLLLRHRLFMYVTWRAAHV